MADLSKLFVSVPDGKVSGFLTKYQSGHETQATGEVLVREVADGVTALYRSTAYDSKIVFLGSTGQIFTQGQLYGANASEISEVVNILSGFDYDSTDAAVKTVAGAIEAAKKALIGTSTAQADGTSETLTSLDERVDAIETLIGAADGSDDGTTIDKLNEVLTWFAGVTENQDPYKVTVGTEEVSLGKGQAGLLTTVAENKLAIGEKGTDAVLYTFAEYTALEGNDAVTEEEFAALSDAAKTKTAATEATGLYKEIADIKSSVDALDVTDTAEDGKYVSAVSQEDGKIIVTRADLPTLSVKDGSGNYVAVENHEIEIKTTALGDAVGLTKKYKSGETVITETEYAALADKTGYSPVWVNAEGTITDAGLATAADVASEIVANEEVIAAALNDHESRLAAVEGGSLTIAEVSKTDDDNKNVSVTVKTANGSVSDVAVAVTEAAYTAATDDAAASISDGIVTGATLNSVLGALWETYSE